MCKGTQSAGFFFQKNVDFSHLGYHVTTQTPFILALAHSAKVKELSVTVEMPATHYWPELTLIYGSVTFFSIYSFR